TELATERIYAAAADSAALHGLDRLNIDDIAARVGCSRATVYRHVGGKRQLRDGVLTRSIARIGAEVAAAVDGLDGQERVVRAILVSLNAIRADAVASKLLDMTPGMDDGNSSLLQSPRLAAAAAELTGLPADDPVAPEWVVRVVLALLYWPMPGQGEEEVVRRFVAVGFA
ncbi:MAG TPA: TetR/AcrR family transcriptional regulator, partial [Mycobacterium sp.]